MTHTLESRLRGDGFAGYAYAYPHKTSYRELDPIVPLTDAWSTEAKNALFLYVHLPFCEFRCGFCNLFTTVQPNNNFVASTLESIHRQSKVVANSIRPDRVCQLAFGGGTPSFLSTSELQQLLDRLSTTWPIDWPSTQTSFEVSPATICPEKLSLLKSFLVNRISMGVQSFSAADLKKLGRPQSEKEVRLAIDCIKSHEFSVFNLDLIYGIEGQTESSWMETIERTLECAPEEIFLYPLYVRSLTGLGRTDKSPSQHRRSLFLLASDALEAAGYQQCSMRLFRRREVQSRSDYCCQEDGMVGLGPGARSYTQNLHYSSEYAVGPKGVKQIIGKFNQRTDQEFSWADYGVRLDLEEQRRRYLIKSLLHFEGLNRKSYNVRFGSNVLTDFPQLAELMTLGMATSNEQDLRLTETGLSWSDVIGPWLYSDSVKSRMEEFELV